MAAGDRPELTGRAPLSANISVHLPSTAEFLRCCSRSFFRTRDLSWLFEAASNGNVRDLLRFVRDVLTSKHLNTKKILDKIADGGYSMPAHEALRALLYQDKMHFDPNASVFVNLFDIQRADPMEHFSRLLTLHYLNRVPSSAATSSYGRLNELIQYLCQLGFSEDHATNTVSYLYFKKCCESRVPDQDWKNVSGDVRITNLGRYHVNELIYTFNYYDAVVVDTPILDSKVRAIVEDVWPIQARLERGEAFLNYLLDASKSIQDADAVRFCDEVFDSAKNEIDEIRTKV